MIIREAEQKDLPAITDLAKEMIDYHHAIDPYYKPAAGYKDLQKDLTKELTDKDGLFLVAAAPERDEPRQGTGREEIVGYFRGSVDPSPGYVTPKRIGTVYDLFVTKNHRQRGVGEQLFKEALAWFQSKKIKHIELNVDARNRAGIEFWKKFGFGEYKIRMRLDLMQ